MGKEENYEDFLDSLSLYPLLSFFEFSILKINFLTPASAFKGFNIHFVMYITIKKSLLLMS